MNMQWAALLLLGSPTGVDAAVDTNIYCPKNYCLVRKAQGNTYKSFGCEQYPYDGYLCSLENYFKPCYCNGVVAYGTRNANVTKQVSGSIECSNANFENPPGGAKGCWCTPTTPQFGGPTAWAEANTTCNAGADVEVPKCMIIKGMTVGIPSLPIAMVRDYYKQLTFLPGVFMAAPLDELVGDLNATVVDINMENMMHSIRIKCSEIGKCIETLDTLKTKIGGDNCPVKAKLLQLVEAYGQENAGNELWVVHTLAEYTWPPKVMPAEPADVSCPSPATGGTQASSLVSVSKNFHALGAMIVAAIAFW